MKPTRTILSWLAAATAAWPVFSVHAQVPTLPKTPKTETTKSAEAAGKAAAKAEAAAKNAAKAESAQKAAVKAEASQKAAEKADNAQTAASKAEAAQKAAAKAEAAQKAASKAEVAQKAAQKAEAASKAATKAESAQKAAEKADVAQRAASKAEAAQKAASKAEVAQKAATKAEAAQKAASKAETAQKSAEKSVTAQRAAEKAQASQKTAQKATSIQETTTRAETASKVTEKTEVFKKAASSAAAAEKLAAKTQAARVLNAPDAPSPTRAKMPALTRTLHPAPAAQATPPPSLPGKSRATVIAFEKPKDLPAVPEEGPKLAPPPPETDEERRLARTQIREELESIQVDKKVAERFANELTDPDKAENARERVTEVVRSEGDLEWAGVDPERRRKVVNEVSKSENPAATANEQVGEAATETYFGEDVAKLVPGDKRKNFRDVFVRLTDIEATLTLLGGEQDDQEVRDAVNEGAQRGVTTREEAREIVDRAGNKLLDRFGFSGKEGEPLADRLDRLAEEQKAEERARLRAIAEKAEAAARARESARQAVVELARTLPSAAATTTAGRSVSAQVDTAIGGGARNASGRGKQDAGVGVDATQRTGDGGARSSVILDRTLVAGDGGKANTGQAAAEAPVTTPPGASAPAQANGPAAAPVVVEQTPVMDQAPGSAPANAPAQAPASDLNQAGTAPAQGAEGVLTVPEDEITVGGGPGAGSTPVHEQPLGNDNVAGDLTFSADGTFHGTVTTVTRDENGNITSSSTVSVVGTWGTNGNGEVVITSATTGTPSSGNNSETAQNNTTTTPTTSDQSSDSGGDGGAQAEATPTPPPEDDKSEEPPPEETGDQATEESKTPNPMDDGGRNPMELAERTGGRLGGEQARRQQKDIALAASGGGAAGPDAKGNQPSGILLTPEERANAERYLNMKTGGGFTDPSPLDRGGMTVTDRDLKELHLRGNGGAKGPTDTAAPTNPQDPHSPVGGLQPIGPVPAQRSVAPVQAVQINFVGFEQIKAEVRSK